MLDPSDPLPDLTGLADCGECQSGHHETCFARWGDLWWCPCPCGWLRRNTEGGTVNATLMVDLSSNNGQPNLRQHWKAGFRVLALKVSEGDSYTWDQHGALADDWHKRGGTVWHYHFARPGSGTAQATRFVALVGPHWRPGDRIALDAEVDGVDAPFAHDFIGACHQHAPTWPGVVYSYASFLAAAKIRPTHGWGLWLADYGATVKPTPPAGWDHLTAWQFTRSAKVRGIPGSVDQSHLYLPDPQPTPKATPLALSTRVALRLATRNLATRHVPVAAVDQPTLADALAQIERVRGLK